MLVRLACGASYSADSHAGEEERLLLEARSRSGLQERTAAALTKANEIVVMMEALYVTGVAPITETPGKTRISPI